VDIKALLVAASCLAALTIAGTVGAQTEAAGVDPPAREQAGSADVSVSYVKTESPPEEKKIWKDKK